MDDLLARLFGNAARIFAAVKSIEALHSRYASWKSRLTSPLVLDFELVTVLESERVEIHRQAKFYVGELQDAMKGYQEAVWEVQRVAGLH